MLSAFLLSPKLGRGLGLMLPFAAGGFSATATGSGAHTVTPRGPGTRQCLRDGVRHTVGGARFVDFKGKKRV